MIEKFFEKCLDIETNDDIVKKTLDLPADKGLILFTDKNSQPLQLLIASSIRRTARSRLLSPQEPVRKEKLKDIAKQICCLPCRNDFYTLLKARQAAKRFFNDIDQVVKIPPPTCIKINTESNWPEFKISNSPTVTEHPKYCFAPLPARKDALALVNIINDVFGLCKMPSLVDDPQKAKTCTYLQMNSCPAPCIKKISKQQYKKQINCAINALTKGPQNQIKIMNKQMNKFAAKTQFEKAAKIRNKISKLQNLNRKAYYWLTPLSKLKILHIDRWHPVKIKRKKHTALKSFLISPKKITISDHFTIDKIDQLIEQTEKMETRPSQIIENMQTKETVSLLSRFLCRKNSAGIWINLSNSDSINKNMIKQTVSEHFK